MRSAPANVLCISNKCLGDADLVVLYFVQQGARMSFFFFFFSISIQVQYILIQKQIGYLNSQTFH